MGSVGYSLLTELDTFPRSHTYMNVRTYVCVCMYVHVRTYVCVCMYVCKYVRYESVHK